MSAYIALLRGINVGGHKLVAMAELRDLMTGLGFDDVRTILQSGNVVFRAKRQAAAKLEKLLAAEAERRFGFAIDIMIRSAEEWRAAVAANPFPEEARRDPARLAVFFAKDAVDGARVEELQGAIRGREVVRASGRQLYAIYPDGMGRSKLTINVIEAKLGTRVTARNWNTVTKLLELL